MSVETAHVASHVYLAGDPGPIECTLEPAVVTALVEGRLGARWLRLPLPDGREAYVEPSAICAVLPPSDDD